MLTIRPSPAARHGGERRAAAQERARQVDPERLVPDAPRSSPANGAGVSTPAAQTSALSWPIAGDLGEQALDSRPRRSRRSAPAWPRRPRPGSGAATPSRASRSRAASTTWAPAAAIASAVAAPIPRLAPVTTASRPASQCTLTHRSTLAGRAARGRRGSAPGPAALRRARGRPSGKARPPSAPPRRRPATSSGATRKPVTPSTITSLRPPRRNATTGVPHACASAATIPNGSSHRGGTQHHGRPGHRLPQRGPGHSLVNGHPGPASPRVDLLPAYSGHRRRRRRRRSARPPRGRCRSPRPRPSPGSAGRRTARPARPIPTRGSHRPAGTAAGSRRRARPGATRWPGTPTRRPPPAAGRARTTCRSAPTPPRPAAGGACARPARCSAVASLTAGASKA